jgi:hypothetical protein
VEVGLALLKVGGGFADEVIASELKWLGGEAFVSFDRQAVELLAARGLVAWVLGSRYVGWIPHEVAPRSCAARSN